MAEGIVPFKDLAKQQLLERCRELEFVDDVQFLKCTRCNRLALEHWYTNCGHALCPNCKRLLSGGRCRCPHCGQFILHIEEQNADFEERVNGLLAKCPNSRYGCPLVTTVKQLQDHVVGCVWTKEQTLPAVYRGTHTNQMLLEEMSILKEQMGEMKGTIGFLLNELNKRLKVEEEIKKSVEMSVEEIKSHLNGLTSELHHGTTTLKEQFKDFDQNNKKELLDLKSTITLDISHKITILEKTINEINYEELKDHFVSKEEVKQLEKALAGIKGNNKLLARMLDQKEERFSQKLTKEVEALDAKILDNINQHNGQIVELKMGLTKLNDYNVELDKYKEDLKIELRGLRSDVNIETRKRQEDDNQLKKEMQIIDTNLKKLISDEFKTIKEDTKKMNLEKKDLEMELRALKLDANVETRKWQEDDNQLKKEMQIIETNLKKLIADEFRAKKEDIKKINLENLTINKEVANINDKIKDQGQQEVQLKDNQLNNSQLPSTNDPIEEFLKHKPSIGKLLDSFLFGKAEEKKVFESLCLKWTIKDKDIVIPTEQWSCDHLSDIFPVYGFQSKAQLKLTIDSDGHIRLYLRFFDEARKGQEVAIKPLPMVTYIIKDLSGCNKQLSRDCYYPFNYSLKYNEFGSWFEFSKSEWIALVSPGEGSVEVLVLVEPMTIIHKPLSVDGSMTDTIEHYSRKLQMAKEGLIYGHWSPPFLTYAGGYRVAVDMSLNRSIGGNKRGLGAWIYFLSGDCDSQLGKTFAHETSVTLINQWDASKNITRKKQAEEADVYEMSIATHDALGSGGFLVNDSFTYHVTVKPIQ